MLASLADKIGDPQSGAFFESGAQLTETQENPVGFFLGKLFFEAPIGDEGRCFPAPLQNDEFPSLFLHFRKVMGKMGFSLESADGFHEFSNRLVEQTCLVYS
jgi:hypothetical protein